MRTRGLIRINAADPARCERGDTTTQGENDMHPILREILLEPVGWLAIGGSIVMVGIAFAVAMFVRRKVREEEKRQRR